MIPKVTEFNPFDGTHDPDLFICLKEIRKQELSV